MDKKEDYKCTVLVIETEFGNKCVENLKKYQGWLSGHGMQRLYHNIESKAENEDVQMGLNVKIVGLNVKHKAVHTVTMSMFKYMYILLPNYYQ